MTVESGLPVQDMFAHFLELEADESESVGGNAIVLGEVVQRFIDDWNEPPSRIQVIQPLK